jgi:cobalt-precorrin 5A hydrolase
MVSIIAFTEQGLRTAARIQKAFPDAEAAAKMRGGNVPESAAAWTAARFLKGNTLVFIGAAGIAVRCIAPCVKDKLTDPAVLVIDEAGRFVIPVLSGHVGGANAMALRIASILGAQAVITTATDTEGLFAVDVFAEQNGLRILNRNGIRHVSARLLQTGRITMRFDPPSAAPADLPQEVRLLSPQDTEPADVIISPFLPAAQAGESCRSAAVGSAECEETLFLVPREICIGMGCRKGRPQEELEAFLTALLAENGIRREAIAGIFSLDLKKEEPGLCGLAEKWKLPFRTFTAEQLRGVPGEFTASGFVESRTGVDNVCERAAMAACGTAGGRLILAKQAKDGMTAAAAVRNWKTIFVGADADRIPRASD